MRKIISYFIKYSVAVNVVILAFVIFGVIGIFRMKSSFFPLIDSQIITINVAYLNIYGKVSVEIRCIRCL